MPRSRSSGALSIWSYAVKVAPPVFARILVIAAVNDVLPWSTWPIVPMLQCGLLRSNFAFAVISLSSQTCGSRRTDTFFTPGFAGELGAGEGNRTLVISLEGCCSTIELHPPGVGSSLGRAGQA